jgi:tetratricopeptide (TPR) repeat protein
MPLAPLVVWGATGLAFGADRASTANPPADPRSDSFALEAQGDLSGALRASRQDAERNPERYFPRVRVAYLELKLNDYAAAAHDYGRAAALAPRSIEALLGKQQALVALARYREAEAIGREVLARDADNYLAASRLAWTLFSLKRYDEAAKLYARILTLYPGDLEMMTGLGYAELRGGRKREAREAFRAVLASVSNHARAREGLAACR